MKRFLWVLSVTIPLLFSACSGPHFGDSNGWDDKQIAEFQNILANDSYGSLCQLEPLYLEYQKTKDTALLSKILVGYVDNLANSCIDIPALREIERELREKKHIKSYIEINKRAVSASSIIEDLRSGKTIKEILEAHSPKNPYFKRLLAYYNSITHPIDEHSSLFMSLQRAKLLPNEGWKTYFLVNIPEFKVRFFEDENLSFEFPVIVGKKSWQTPIFSSKMKYIELNPRWNVPDNIAKAEEIPHLLRNRNYLKQKNMIVLDRKDIKREIDPSKVAWNEFLGDDYKHKQLPYRIVQLPGSRNALGRVKFKFPNRYAVYMHDTNRKGLFKRKVRAFSHGCIRLAKPMMMLEYLAKKGYLVSNWDLVKKRLDSKKLAVIPLKEPIYVHIVYFTAYPDESGLKLIPDIYNLDKLTPLKKGN